MNRGEFRSRLTTDFDLFLHKQALRFDPEETLRIDLHCHDRNSDIPDELWGRILGLPESWLKTDKLVKCLRNNGSDVITVTNHNNARSCWQLLDAGQDVLVGAEFTCYFPELDIFLHVLTYGFSPAEEQVLEQKRQNIYHFLAYAAERDIPVVLPHPLYFYTRNEAIDNELFEKLALMFQRFEVLNGQRDLWQTNLTLNWVESLSAEKMDTYARRHGIDPRDFGVDIQAPKVLTGGSDDHMGIFAGQCGSFLQVPELRERLKTQRPSELALEAIRAGRMAPYGHVGEYQKLNIALLDYFSQVATHLEDPGLLRILLHRGELNDKVACFAISNILLELQKNKNSLKFFNFVHDALQGKKPNKLITWKIPKRYRFCVKHLERIADSKHESPQAFVNTVNDSISELFAELNRVILGKLRESRLLDEEIPLHKFSTEELARNMEIPSQVSALLFGADSKHGRFDTSKIKGLVDGLSFPLLIALVLFGSTAASTRLLYKNRQFLNDFSHRLGRSQHGHRALHLTDTLYDKNGVSNSLGAKLREFQGNDLAVDMLVCHEDAVEEAHLHVVRPLDSFVLPESGGQKIRIPDLMQVVRLFCEGGYDRIVCSTEGPMVAAALLLKYMFNVPAYFFMHTDWIEYIKCTTNATQHERDRIRRLLRLLYSQFDGLFVLNSDHRDWLTSHEMQLDPDRVFLTAHHAHPPRSGITPVNKSTLFDDASADTPVLFIACRLSEEKGLADLPEILRLARQRLPQLKLVVAGEGPARAQLEREIPDAAFLGWVDRERLDSLYAGLDMFVFPSRFDTFGNVVLEAFSHGMPVIAYNCKGPRDIIEHERSGYLVEDIPGMAQRIVEHFSLSGRRSSMSANARARTLDYRADVILTQFLSDIGLPAPACRLGQRPAA
ncbi:MAG: glycosyl transferase family 1 [Halioglobus sp.]|nr:glycosyl transferase family 1 [Halioglobus sp.]